MMNRPLDFDDPELEARDQREVDAFHRFWARASEVALSLAGLTVVVALILIFK